MRDGNALNDVATPSSTAWAQRPSAKDRAGVQRAVTQLLDELAPERTPPRAAPPVVALKAHRSPRGCVLQSEQAAISLSWFGALATDDSLGELQLILWQGTVTLPGASKRSGANAVALKDMLFQPVPLPTGWGWKSADGRSFSTPELAEWTRSLLAEEIDAVALRLS